MRIYSLFDSPIIKTRITSAEVRKKEMILGYFTGPFLAMISNAIFGSYLNRYYSDIIGWTDTTRFGFFSALLPVASVVFVIVGNLMIGRLIDHTRTVHGKARPFMLLSAPLIPITFALLFSLPLNSSPIMQMIWIAVSYNLYYAVAYPFFFTAHSSMVALSTRSSKHRGILATFSNASNVAAVGLGANILIPMLLQRSLFVIKEGKLDTAESYNNWRIVMVVLCFITFIAILIEYYYTRERITEENVRLSIKEEKLSIPKQANSCIKSSYWWLIILYFLLFQLGGLVKNGSMAFYTRWMFDSVTDEASAGLAMGSLGLIGGLPTALGMLLAWPIANKLGKRNSVLIGMIISVLGGLVSFLDVHNFYIVSAGIIIKGIGSIPAMYITLALLSDVLDHLEAKNKYRSDGFTMALYGSIMVGMTGLGNGIINALLTLSGYNPALPVQNAAVQNMLAFSFLGMELVCYTFIIIILIFLNVETHVKSDQIKILENQKQAVLKAGSEWVEPADRLKKEEIEAEELKTKKRLQPKKRKSSWLP